MPLKFRFTPYLISVIVLAEGLIFPKIKILLPFISEFKLLQNFSKIHLELISSGKRMEKTLSYSIAVSCLKALPFWPEIRSLDSHYLHVIILKIFT